MCDRVAIMYLGRIVELAPAEALFARPTHPYTRALLASAPSLQPGQNLELASVRGDPPSPRDIPSGCAFRGRCRHAAPCCAETVPPLETVAPQHEAACLRWREIDVIESSGPARDDVHLREVTP
jgi:peptide/nickel transport system ATP-binding protein